jgi:hypothetical protein
MFCTAGFCVREAPTACRAGTLRCAGMNQSDEPLRTTIAAWLRDQGHAAAVQAQDERYAEILFQARGYRFSVRVDEHDRGFLYLALGMELPPDAVDELLVRRAIAQTESRTKVVKVELDWELRGVLHSAEQFVTEPGGPTIFWRTVSTLIESIHTLRRALDEAIGRCAASRFTAELESELSADEHAAPAPTEESR